MKPNSLDNQEEPLVNLLAIYDIMKPPSFSWLTIYLVSWTKDHLKLRITCLRFDIGNTIRFNLSESYDYSQHYTKFVKYWCRPTLISIISNICIEKNINNLILGDFKNEVNIDFFIDKSSIYVHCLPLSCELWCRVLKNKIIIHTNSIKDQVLLMCIDL